MAYWANPVVITFLSLAVLLVLAEGVRAVIPPLKNLGVPASIVAGALGLLIGPGVLGLLPMDTDVLETVVYHGLAVVFIAVALQTPKGGKTGPGVRSMAFGITTMVGMQTALGLLLALGLGVVLGSHLHPGFGLLLPLSFEQGPGQALALGAAWEEGGLPDGAQVGLIMAAIGFAWSVVIGVPLVAYGRAKGWVSDQRDADSVEEDTQAEEVLPAGSLELLTRQIVAIGGIYGATYLVCIGASTALAGMPDIAAMVWGFHFMIGAVIAMAVRPLLAKLPAGSPIHDGLQGRIASVTVDGITCAALSAVQLAVLGAHILPILLITSVGGIATLVGCVLLARRAFPEAWFEHAVLWFGMSTGTLPMGLALLRMVDPELKSPAPVSAVLGSAASILGVAPIVLVIHPIPDRRLGRELPDGRVRRAGRSSALQHRGPGDLVVHRHAQERTGGGARHRLEVGRLDGLPAIRLRPADGFFDLAGDGVAQLLPDLVRGPHVGFGDQDADLGLHDQVGGVDAVSHSELLDGRRYHPRACSSGIHARMPTCVGCSCCCWGPVAGSRSTCSTTSAARTPRPSSTKRT